MAANGAQESFAPADVLGAVMTMRSGEQETKKKAHEYLERFQKSVRCTAGSTPQACTLTIVVYRRILGALSSAFSSPTLLQKPRSLPPSLSEER